MLEAAPTLIESAVALAAASPPGLMRVSDSSGWLRVSLSPHVLHSYRLDSLAWSGPPPGLLADLLDLCQQLEWFVELANIPTDHGGNSGWAASVNLPLNHATARTYATPAHALMVSMTVAVQALTLDVSVDQVEMSVKLLKLGSKNSDGTPWKTGEAWR